MKKFLLLAIFPFLLIPAFGETMILEGSDANREIFIADDGINNIIILQSDTGISKHFDSKVRHYNSGGFSMKNPESGIAVFGHPINDNQYKLLVLTSDKIYKFIGISGILSELDEQTNTICGPGTTFESETNSCIVYEISNPEENCELGTYYNATENACILNETIEPVSSIGADITKYDIPIITRDDDKTDPILTIIGMEYDKRYLNDKLDEVYRIYEVRQAKNIVGAEVTLEISRDGFVHKKLNGVTGNGGLVRFEINDMIYPLFYPNFCYNLDIVATYGNLTATWDDDFVMGYPSNVRFWEANLDWIGESRWNYLPSSFQTEPRLSIYSDSKCN